MNSIANHKIEKLVAQIEAQDLKVLHAAIHSSDDIIRNIVDNRRQLIAMLERELMAETGRESARIEDVYTSNQDILEFIQLWCDRVKKISFTPSMLSNEDYCHLTIDAYMPQSWNWMTDLVILIYPRDETIFNSLSARGQKNIVAICDPENCVDQQKIAPGFDRVFISTDYLDLADKISKINTRVRHVTTLHCDPEHPMTAETLEKVQESLKLGRKTAQIGVNTSARFGHSWACNIIKNIPKMAQYPNLSDLRVTGVKNAVVVAPGPSLEKNIARLKEIQDSLFVVTVLRAASIMERHGITPDLVVQIDALSDSEAQHLAANPPTNITNLFLEGAVNPVLFDLGANQIIWSLLQHVDEVHQLYGTQPTPFSAPSVALYAAHLCQSLGMESICLLGQDLAAAGDTVYAAGATEHLQQSGEALQFNIPTPGFWGGTVHTRQDFAFYLEQYAILAEQWKQINPDLLLINATEGGAFIDGFDHMRFDDFLALRHLPDTTTKKTLNFDTKRTVAQDDIVTFHQRTAHNLGTIMKLASKIITLDQQPDINAGKQKKLQKLLRHFSELNQQVPFLELAMQQEITETVGNAKSTSSIPSYAEFFRKVQNAATILEQAATATIR
jgi:hypothetical protein